ncbi:hypothetical protein [Aureimonas altamirensis]|uniref:hypothetical protein n=1 Tax=Aureimonas altamirensis TaxID=370622 RepID=UPI000AFE30E7|nr:hypothetical protein [Aureimonas altamirensis]
MSDKTESITFRISPDLKRRLEEEARLGPYPVSMSDVVKRGIELALDELCDLRNEGAR